jgi:hypothetical protein
MLCRLRLTISSSAYRSEKPAGRGMKAALSGAALPGASFGLQAASKRTAARINHLLLIVWRYH